MREKLNNYITKSIKDLRCHLSKEYCYKEMTRSGHALLSFCEGKEGWKNCMACHRYCEGFSVEQYEKHVKRLGLPSIRESVSKKKTEIPDYIKDFDLKAKAKISGFQPVLNYTAEIAKMTSRKFEEFLEECLKPYGITPENMIYYSRRIRVEKKEFSFTVTDCDLTYHRVYLDGKYIFTIRTKTYSFSRDDKTEIDIKHMKIFEEDMEEKYGGAD